MFFVKMRNLRFGNIRRVFHTSPCPTCHYGKAPSAQAGLEGSYLIIWRVEVVNWREYALCSSLYHR